ncbi:uncharacterized protein LOC130795675 [Actinidia eriantha]|uniref:uncharacterized protein LOC130795675 n=1 Tax=Actinidia eriantha TaxID=165200 RepID=UPI00258EC198|nr:uncharacterized protein LOC130795675 [Actinidia eriantha]
MGPKRRRARTVGRGIGGRGATRRGTPIEDMGDQGIASQTQQGADRGVLLVAFAREVAAAMLEMGRTRHEKIRIQRDITGARLREAMKEFRKMNPPSFDGLSDHMVAGNWLSQIRKIFDNVKITKDDMKVSFASYQLVGEADEWWKSIKEANRAYRDELRDQFEKLVQGDMTVSEYAKKFQSLSQFTPNLVNTKAKKCKRVEPKKEHHKEFKGSWFLRHMSVGTSSTTSGSFNKKRQREGTHGSIGQQMLWSSIPPSSSNPSAPSRVSRSQIVYHQYNQRGHIRSEYPQSLCYNCGQQGHISTNYLQGKNTLSGVGSVQQQSSGQTSNYQQRNQQQRNQSQQSHQSVAFERESNLKN